MHLLTKLSPKHEDFELTEDNCSSEIRSTYSDPSIGTFWDKKLRELKWERFFSRPEKKGAKRGKTDGKCCCVYHFLSKLLGVKLEIRVIYKVQQEIKVGVRKDQTFQIGF